MSAAPSDPVAISQKGAKVEFPRRFYKLATAEAGEGGHVLKLDGRTARTPGKRPLAVASAVLGEALAAEWNAVTEQINPGKMPLTRIVNTALDRVPERIEDVRAEVAAYAGSDLVCYRADGPASLVAAEAAAWDPLLAFAREALGARFILVEGIVHAAQPAAALAAVRAALAGYDALALSAVSTITTLTGSVIIALALAHGRLSPDAAWEVAHVDEDFQMRQWGTDQAALARRAGRRTELDAARLILLAR